eukprot:Gb_09400 [translate_table: standard]
MKFGKGLQTQIEETLPEWRDKFLAYKPLKKRLKQISAPDFFTGVGFYALNLPRDGHSTSVASVAGAADQKLRDDNALINENPELVGTAEPLRQEKKAGICDTTTHCLAGAAERKKEGCRPWICEEENFINLLNEELQKFNDFFVDKEEEYVIRIQELKERIERVKEQNQKNGAYKSETQFGEEMIKIRKDIVTIHGEMVLLENYSSLNFAGLVKILKKYDKRTGALLRLPFTQRVLHQPFFTTELLSKLVRECEEKLESVFPSTSDEMGHGLPDETNDPGDRVNVHETVALQEESVETIYRSTLAAMRTIQELRSGSSTYSPLSLPRFVQNEIENGSGVIIDENMIPNSPNIIHTIDHNKENVLSID